jgi:hypothetical protein
VLKAVVEAHQFAQQVLQPTAALPIAHSVQHNYQVQTAASCVTNAQVALLVADLVATSTAAAV